MTVCLKQALHACLYEIMYDVHFDCVIKSCIELKLLIDFINQKKELFVSAAI